MNIFLYNCKRTDNSYVRTLVKILKVTVMNVQKGGLKYKVLIGILSMLLIGLAIYSISMYKDSKNTVASLERQRVEIQKELSNLVQDYEEVITENELKDEEINGAKNRIEELLIEVENSKANMVLIEKYRQQINQLQNERKILFARADSLVKANERLIAERDSTSIALSDSQRKLDSLSVHTNELTQAMGRAMLVTARNLNAQGVIIRNNGRISHTKRSGRADDVQACFTLNANRVAKDGEREIYVQVINPKNNILGQQGVKEIEGEVLFYSKSIRVFYENEDLDVCILSEAEEEDLIPGRYVINIYDGIVEIGTTTIELR